jgi:hypothetical protein
MAATKAAMKRLALVSRVSRVKVSGFMASPFRHDDHPVLGHS